MRIEKTAGQCLTSNEYKEGREVSDSRLAEMLRGRHVLGPLELPGRGPVERTVDKCR